MSPREPARRSARWRHWPSLPNGAIRLSARVTDGSPRRLAPSVASGALSVACGIGLLATSGWLITRAAERPPVFVLSIAIGAVQAFALGRGLARYLHRLAVHGLSLEVLGALRLWLFDRLEPLVPGSIGGAATALNALVADSDSVAESLATSLTGTIEISTSILLGSLVACAVDLGPGLIVLSGALAMVGVAVASARLGRRGAEQEVALRGDVAEAVIETVRSAPELIAYGRADLLDERLAALRRRSVSAAWRRGIAVGLGRGAVGAVAGGALVAAVAAGLAVHDGHRLSGVLLAVLVFVALAVLDQCAALPAVLGGAAAGNAAAHRLEVLADAPSPAREPTVDRSPEPGAISAALEGVSVVLGDTEILREVSISLEPGARVALVGPNGSGKTTAVHVLLHFLECWAGGASIGGIPVSEMTRAGIARHLGWMAGETYVFATSLLDNLRIARPAASAASCERALDRVGLGSWYSSLPEGLATALGAGGRPLSAGERQRLGMARTLLAGGSVLLLDEPTAHLDPSGSAQAMVELLDAAGARAVLLVTHDPSTVALADDVVTLEAGRVLERTVRRRAQRSDDRAEG